MSKQLLNEVFSAVLAVTGCAIILMSIVPPILLIGGAIFVGLFCFGGVGGNEECLHSVFDPVLKSDMFDLDRILLGLVLLLLSRASVREFLWTGVTQISSIIVNEKSNDVVSKNHGPKPDTQPLSTNQIEVFQHAKELIRHRRYDDARKILAMIDHPKAREWEAKLNEFERHKEMA